MIGRARTFRLLNAIHLALLVGACAWLRLTSLEDMPTHLGDEAFYGNQAARLVRGQSFSIWTTSGNPASPFYIATQAPFALLLPPSLWAIRAASAFSGLATVLLVFLLFRRVLDRPTALIAATILAALPASIIMSRIGCEFAQTPLFCLVALYFAWRANGPALLFSYAACLVVHSTNIFLLPVLLAVYLTRALARLDGDRPARRRLLVRVALLSATAVVALAVVTFRRGATRSFYAESYRGHDWPAFARSLPRFFFCQWPRLPEGAGWSSAWRPYDWAYATAATVALAAGSLRLWQARRWDRLALVAGLLASASGLHVVAGPLVLTDPTYRYGSFLIVPTVLALACAIRALLAPRGEPHPLALSAVLASAWPLLLIVQWNWFDYFTGPGRESIWTLRNERADPQKQMLARIVRDARSRPDGGRAVILAQDWATLPQMEYLARPRRDVEVVSVNDGVAAVEPRRRRELRDGLIRSAYAVAHAGDRGELNVRTLFPPACLRSWDVPDLDGRRMLNVERLNREVPVPADYDGDGKADLAAYRPGSGDWLVQESSTGRVVARPLAVADAPIPAPADYDGDGRADAAAFRPSDSAWFVGRSSPGFIDPDVVPLAVPAPADYDGDGRDDRAVFRPLSASWVIATATGATIARDFGPTNRALAVPADYDGDGRADLAVFDLVESSFLVLHSSDGTGRAIPFGGPPPAVPVPADYDGDGRADPAVYRPGVALWHVKPSRGGDLAVSFGHPGRSLPAPADYDGDGLADLAVVDPESDDWRIRFARGGPDLAARTPRLTPSTVASSSAPSPRRTRTR